MIELNKIGMISLWIFVGGFSSAVIGISMMTVGLFLDILI